MVEVIGVMAFGPWISICACLAAVTGLCLRRGERRNAREAMREAARVERARLIEKYTEQNLVPERLPGDDRV